MSISCILGQPNIVVNRRTLFILWDYDVMTIFGERLKKARLAAGMTQAQLGKIVGVKPPSISEAESVGLSSTKTLEYAKALNVDPMWLATGKGKMQIEARNNEIEITENSDYLTVQYVDFKLSAGVTGYLVDYLGESRKPIVFSKEWVKSENLDPNRLFAVKVSGRSMEYSLCDGDLVVINTASTQPIDGRVFAINYEGELVIKRMRREQGQWFISSDNQDKRQYADKLCHDECLIIGLVISKQSSVI